MLQLSYPRKPNISVNIGDFALAHTVKNVILACLYLIYLLKSALKMQEMPFQRPKIQKFPAAVYPGTSGHPYKCVITV